MKKKPSDLIFDIFIYFTLIIAVLACLLPFFHIMSVSLSSSSAVMLQKVSLFPVGLNFEAYRRVLGDNSMIRSLFFTIYITVLFTILGMFLTICYAYPLTRKNLKGRNVFLFLGLFTLYFGGGIIPEYVLINDLGLMNTMWCLILPLALSPYNMIILKTFFTNSIPESLEESAKLDGCSDIGILLKIVLPLSTPVLATLSLFFAVGRWNSFQDALFYISDAKLYPLQLKLYYIVNASGSTETLVMESGGGVEQLQPEVIRAASVMFATIPIILVYPWLQKYFVKGVMIGAVKG